jgi:hypothetical protein
LLAQDAQPGDSLGYFELDMDGTTAVMSAYLAGPLGAAYLFEESGGGWSQTARLVPPDPGKDVGFGAAVAASGAWVFVGCPDDDPAGPRSGSVLVYRRNSLGWWPAPPAGAPNEPSVVPVQLTPKQAGPNQRFGSALSARDSELAVGSPWTDRVHIFQRSGSHWSEAACLTPAQVVSGSFGRAISLGPNTILIGAPNDSTFGQSVGAAHVFARSASGWQQVAKLIALNGQPVDLFGSAVALDGDLAVVGAPGADPAAVGYGSGAAYVFERTTAGWVQSVLVPSDGAAWEQFGTSVAVHRGWVLVGAHKPQSGKPGVVYLFEQAASGEWVEQASLSPMGGHVDDLFGWALSTSDDRLLVAAIRDDAAGIGAGAAYVFDLSRMR